MNDDRVSKLRVVETNTSANLTEDALLTDMVVFIGQHLLDLTGDYEEDIILEQPRSDERRLGLLTPFERKVFVLAALLEQNINDRLIDMEATSTERVSLLMRERKVNFHTAAQIYMQENRTPDDEREIINMSGLTHANLSSLYDWSVRRRYGEWKNFLIVRQGFCVYSHG